MNNMKHSDGAIDRRYTITREYTGHASGRPQYVTRFEGKWVDAAPTLADARKARRWAW